MTFEEFFLKKKIDLNQLQAAESNLFAQFKDHYAVMNEKSFDHTKKYWFNRLRHQYPLSAEEETRLKEVYSPKTETQAVSLENVNGPKAEAGQLSAKPSGFKPKFKAPSVQKEATPASAPTEEVKEQVTAKPAGFKPRFKAGAATTVEKTEELPPKEITKEEIIENPAKPVGFKPRFKAGATAVVKEELPPKQIESPEDVISPETEVETANPTEGTAQPAYKPIGFKPRFKADTTTVVKEEDTKEELPPKQIEKPVTETQTEEAKAEIPKPLGFKPRFKAGATQVVNKENNEELPPKQIDDSAIDNKP